MSRVSRWAESGANIASQPGLHRVAASHAWFERRTSSEPCEQVGLQLGMSVARIMRSEANRGLSTVLQAFIDTMLQRQQLPPHALLALLHTAKELGTMRLPAHAIVRAAQVNQTAIARGPGTGRPGK